MLICTLSLDKMGISFLEDSPHTVLECCGMESLGEGGVGWRLSLCKSINPSTTLEATIQRQPDNEFYPSNSGYILCISAKRQN